MTSDLEKIAEVRLSVLADLVAGHVDRLWMQVTGDPEVPGCCPECCAPCNALRQLQADGMLDYLYGIYMKNSGGGESETWDDERGRLEPSWFDKAWTVDMGCGHGGLYARLP